MQSKILIVDDSREFRKLIRDFLTSQKLSLDFCEANSGELAVFMARNEKPDIVLMDVWLPRMNGVVAAEEIKKDHPHCSVIIVTMFEQDIFKQGYRRDGICDFICKTDVYEKLVPILKRYLKA